MSFTTEIKLSNKKAKDKIDRTRRIVIIKLFSAVILDTPVLTGRLRGNWQTTVGFPAIGELARTSKTATLNQVEKVAGKSSVTDTVMMQNNLPYAYRIEYDGWSSVKAPQGMVRRNVTRFKQLVEEAIQEGRL